MAMIDRQITIQGDDDKTKGVSAMRQLVNKRAPALLIAVASLLAIASATAAVKATGPGMMGGTSRHGMMGTASASASEGGAGISGTATPTGVQLQQIAAKVNSWLASSGFESFKTAEVMAFTNNDYVAVHDAQGMPAFELLTNLKTTWVMEEPPSMMWNTKYGTMGDLGSRVTPMMGGGMMGDGSWNSWYGPGAGRVPTTSQAVTVANNWLSKASPGETVATDAGGSAMGKFPGYYSFDTVKNGKTRGMLSVNASTGAIWYHGWHGTFLAQHQFAT
jgi:hypothetical protein